MARWGRSGKTPPLLLDDIIHYDINVPADAGHHPWKDGPPVYEEDENFEVERRSRSCKHQYILKERQSKTPAIDERPSPNTAFNVAAICQKCRTHLDIEVNYPNLWQFKSCPNEHRPFHHLVFRSSHVDLSDDDDVPGKGPEYKEKFVFECSWPDCAVTVYVKLKEPLIKNHTVHQLIDPELLLARQNAAIKAEPQKMEGMGKAEGFDVLSDLRQYIRNAWDATKAKGSTGGKIQVLNKRFMMRFGHSGLPCRAALESFGFTLKENEYWDPPHPNFDDQEPYTDPFNNFLDDIDYELSILMQQHPPRLRPQGTEPAPIPAQREFNRILGSQNYDQHYASRTQDLNPMAPWYRGLGVVPDVSDEAVVYAYERQCATDPDNTHRYLDYLRSIMSLRKSEILQMKYFTEESAGKYTASQLEEAYLYFGFDPHNPPTDEQNIIGTFSSRLDDAPMQESDMRHALRLIGTHMKSQKILDIADESLTTYEQALAFLDVNPDTADDFVTATIAVKLGDISNAEERRKMEDKCHKAVKIIAEHRHSLALTQWLQTGELGNIEMDIGEAYSLLGIHDRTLDDAMILTTYQLRLEDNKSNADTYNRALRTIAKNKNSIYLEQFLTGNGLSADAAQPDWPVGLGNIGNTCYLNSLLQFCFTIKGLREVVMNFDKYRMELNAETVSHKKVGSRKVSLAEIQRSQRFAVELSKLFRFMVRTSKASITPEEQLARLTLIGPSTFEAARRRSTLHGQPPIPPASIVDADIISEPVQAEDRAAIISEIERGESPTDGTLDTSVGFQTNASSESTLGSMVNTPEDEAMPDVDIKAQQNQVLNDKENLPPYKSSIVEVVSVSDSDDAQPLEATSNSKLNAQAGVVEQSATQDADSQSDAAVPAPLNPPSRPPPVPPRPKAPEQRKSTIQDLEDITKQQDVTEVMSNVLFQLSCAIKPTGIDKDGEQLDQIKNLFFGKVKTRTLQKGQEPINEIQRFSDIKVNVAEGPRDIYQALEAAFDVQEVISNGNPALQFSSITDLPPIFSVQIQRTQFDFALKRTYKSVNHLELFQTIFLDRFLDDELDSPLMERRREAWEWKKDLAALEARQTELSETEEHSEVSQSLNEAREVLMALQSSQSNEEENPDALNISPSTISTLELLSSESRRELQEISAKLPTLRQKIATQYTDLRQHPYNLHSVFVHRGTSSFGHYWIYIYDFTLQIWRKYNDSSVTEVRDTEIFNELEKQQTGGGSPPTSVYLVYVKEDERDSLVGSVFRDPVTEEADVTEDWVMNDAPTSAPASAPSATNAADVPRFSFESSDTGA